MDTPPTYQEATTVKKTWLRRLVGRLFSHGGRTPSHDRPSSDTGALVDSKLINPLYPESKPKPKIRPTSLILPQRSSSSKPSYRNSIIHTSDQPTTNHVRIKRNNAPITGVWNIDTSLQVPDNLLVQLNNKEEARHHLHLWSVKQAINAIVNVVGEGKETALITCSTLGKVHLQVSKPQSRTISLFCRGTLIALKIPRTYRGIIKAHTQSGSVHFSEEVGKVLSTIYEKGHESRHWVGNMGEGGKEEVIKKEGGEELGGEGGEEEEGERYLPEVDSDYEHDHIPSLRIQKLSRSESQRKNQKEKEKEKEKYDVMKLKAKTREGEHYGEVFIAFSDEEEMPLRALYIW